MFQKVTAAYGILTDCFTMSLCIKYSEAELAFACLTLAVQALGDAGNDLSDLIAPLAELQQEIQISDTRLGELCQNILDGYPDGKLEQKLNPSTFDIQFF